MADDAAAFLEPLHVHPVRDVPADPHQEDHEHTEREREAQVVVRVLRPLRPVGEGFGADERQQQRLAEGDIEAGQREDDEAGRRHPVHQAFERGKAHQRASGSAGFDANHAADQIEGDEDREHAEDRDGADPAQRHLVELTPVATGRLLDRARFLVGKRAAAANSVEFLEELILFDRARRWIDRAVGIALLSTDGACNGDDQRERDCAEDETQTSSKFRHVCSSLHRFCLCSRRPVESSGPSYGRGGAWSAPPLCTPLSGTAATLATRSRASFTYDAIVSR